MSLFTVVVTRTWEESVLLMVAQLSEIRRFLRVTLMACMTW